MERYPPAAATAGAGPRPREGDPSTVAMIVLESGHYYQVRITPHLQECHWSLEAVNSMIPASAGGSASAQHKTHTEHYSKLPVYFTSVLYIPLYGTLVP